MEQLGFFTWEKSTNITVGIFDTNPSMVFLQGKFKTFSFVVNHCTKRNTWHVDTRKCDVHVKIDFLDWKYFRFNVHWGQKNN